MGVGFLTFAALIASLRLYSNLYRFSQQVIYQSHYGEAQQLRLGHLYASYPTVSAGRPLEYADALAANNNHAS